ncbi:uncharacterized protein isoform X2 [Rhodnius prolixus]|uniref:uncharacterized protein isoform X2 n=1 Tax=Rhodnius prolixus TaxID=13249 RepID=UPI003D18C53D
MMDSHQVQTTFFPYLSSKSYYLLTIQNVWTSKTLFANQVKDYLPDKQELCPELAKLLKIRKEGLDGSFYGVMKERFENRKNVASTDLSKEIWTVTVKYKGVVCKLTARLIEILSAIEDEVLSKDERNIDNILNHQIMWNKEIEAWKVGVSESAKIIQTHFEKYVPRYQNMLKIAGFYSMEDINAILNRLVLHTNQIIINNLQNATTLEMKLKLAYNSIVKEEVIKQYYNVMLENNNLLKLPPQKEKLSFSDDTLWKKKLFQDLNLIHDMFKENFPEPTSIPELKNHVDLLVSSMKYLFYYLLAIMKLIYSQVKHIIDNPSDPESDENSLIFWREYILMMKDYIHESKNLVEKGINSWNQTISRMELIKVMAKAAVDQHRCINIFYEEVEINILLDKLRDCSELKFLNQIYQQIKMVFEKYEKRINTKHTEEMKIINVPHKSFNISRDLFESACNLLNEYVDSLDQKESGKIERALNYEDTNVNEIENKIYMHLRAAKNWRRAFSDSLKMISAELKEIIPFLIETWTNDILTDILQWYKNKLRSLHRRKIRIKTDIIDVRAAELDEHRSRLKRHIAGVYDNYDKLAKLENLRDSLKRLNNELEEDLKKEQTLSVMNALRIQEIYKNMRKQMEKNRARKSYLIRREIENIERLFHWLGAANKNFLKKIRFFGENGNFSPKEAQVAVIALQRMEGFMPIMKSQIIKSVRELEMEFKIKPTLLTQKENLKFMLRKHVELDFKEMVVSEMLQLRNSLIDESQKLLKNIRTLETKSRKINTWSPEIMKSLLKKVHTLATHLSFPEFMKKLEMEVPPSGDNHSLDVPKKQTVVDIISRDYVQDVQTGTPFPPTFNEDNFICKTKSQINNSLTKLQKNARYFYFKSKEERRRKIGTAPISNKMLFRKFMEGVVSIFKGYNLQCERIWLENILDFLSILHLIHDRFMNFIIKMLKATWVWWKFKLKNLNDDYEKTFEGLTVKASKERDALKNELKPWYGFPDKKPMMSILGKKATNHCRALARRLCLRFNQFKVEARNIMKNVFLISTQLFVRLKVLKNALLEHRGLQTILTKIAKFVDRYAQEFFGTQVTTEPGPNKMLQIDFLLEPGGKSRLWSIPNTTVLKIAEAETDSHDSLARMVVPAKTEKVLKAAIEVEVNGILFRTGFTTNIELVSDLARLLMIVSNVPLNYTPELAGDKQGIELLHFNLEKKVISLKKVRIPPH